jgi:hypothetical protein
MKPVFRVEFDNVKNINMYIMCTSNKK